MTKIERKSNVSQEGKVLFTQNFSNREICFANLVFNQIDNNFHLHKVFCQKSFKTFIKKIKRLKGRLGKCKKYGGIYNRNVS